MSHIRINHPCKIIVSPNRSIFVLAVARLFFPMTRAIGVEVDCPFTHGLLRKIVYAGSQSASFVQATKDLQTLAEVNVSRERVQRWTKRVGQQRIDEARAAAGAYQKLPLPERRHSPHDHVPRVAWCARWTVAGSKSAIARTDRLAISPTAIGVRRWSVVC